MSGGAAQTLEDNRLASMALSTGAASQGVARRFGGVAGNAVQPVVWVLDARANGNTPDKVDAGLWVFGLFGGIASGAAFVTGLVKAFVDDNTRQKLEEVRRSEPAARREFIHACVNRGGQGRQFNNAMKVAMQGGTAWKHPNGLWVFITDAAGRLIVDYEPQQADEILGPTLPLKEVRGGYQWTQRRRR